MPRSSCDPCCNPVAFARPDESFHAALLQIECAILAAIEGGTPGAGCCHDEDTPAVSGDSGTPPLFVRSDSPTTLTDADGDYSFGVVNSLGAQHTTLDFTFQTDPVNGYLKLSDDLMPGTPFAGAAAFGVRDENLLLGMVSNDGAFSPFTVNDAGAIYTSPADNRLAIGTLGTALPKFLSVPKVSNTATNFTGIASLLTGYAVVTSGAAMTAVESNSEFTIAGNPGVHSGDMVHVTSAANTQNMNVWAPVEIVVGAPPTQIQLSKGLPAIPTVGDQINVYRPLPVTGTQGSNNALILDTSVTTSSGMGQQFINLVKFEDDATVSGDSGIGVLFKRLDTSSVQTGANGDYSLPVCNSFGVIHVNVDATFQKNTSDGLLKQEDVGSLTGDAGVAAIYKRTDTAASQTSATNDYTFAVTNSFGTLHANIDRTFQRGDADGILKAEDVGAGAGHAGVASLSVRQDTLASSTDADNDYQFVKSNSAGAVYTAQTFQARTTNPTAAADAAASIGISDKLGRQVVTLHQVRDLVVQQSTQIASSAAETTILAAGAASVFHDMVYMTVSNASGTATTVTIRDATGGATIMTIDLPALGTSGSMMVRPIVPIKQTTAANNWTAQLSSALVTVNFFVQAVKNL